METKTRKSTSFWNWSEYALCAYTASVLTLTASAKFTMVSTALGGLLALVVAAEVLPKFSLKRLMLLRPFLTFVGFSIATLLYYPKGAEVGVTLFQIGVLVSCTYITILHSKSTRSVQYGLAFGVLAIWYLQGAAFSQSTKGARFEFQLEDEAGLNPNLYGLFLCLAIWFQLREFFVINRNVRKISLKSVSFLFSALVVLICVQQVIFTTGSRKAVLMLLLLCGSVFFLTTKGESKASRWIVGAGISVVAGYYAFTLFQNSAFFHRFQNLLDFLEGRRTTESSLNGRSDLVRNGFNLWLSSPIIGHGLDSFRTYGGKGFYSHSNPIELLANGGIVGFALYYWSHWLVLKNGLSKFRSSMQRPEAIWIMTGLALMVVVFEPFAITYNTKVNAIFVGTILAASLFGFEREETNIYAGGQ